MNFSARPTRVRYTILAMLCVMAMITYLDRTMNARAQNEIMAAVGRPVADFFWVLTAFQLAYALFEIPTGYLGDRYGPRKTILRLVLVWSFFVGFNPVIGMIFPHEVQLFGMTVLLAYSVLIFAELMFGAGEAGAFPNITRALYNWFPVGQRGFAQGAIWLSARFMGGMAPVIWVLLVELGGLSWRQALWLFALAGGIWCAVFYWWFRNHPHEHTAVNQAEKEYIEAGRSPQAEHHGVPWKKIFTNRNVLALCAMYMVTNFNWYFLMYNLPIMLKNQFTQPNPSARMVILLGVLGGAPMLVGMVGCLLGGIMTDRYVRRTGDRRWGRRIFAMAGYSIAGVCYLVGAQFTDNLLLFAGCVMLVGFFNDWIMGPSWAACQDVGQRYSAIVSGTMNMIGNLGAVLGIQVTGRILKAYTVDGTVNPDGYVVLFTIYGFLYLLGAGLWLLIDASKPIRFEDEPVLPIQPESEPEEEDYRENGR